MAPKKVIQHVPKKKEIQLISKLYREIGYYLGLKLAKTSLTAIQLAIIGIVVGIISAVQFYFGEYHNLIIAAICLQLNVIIDFMDGPLALAKGIASDFGAWLDNNGGLLVDFLIVFAICLGLYQKGFVNVWFWGFLVVSSKYMIKTLYLITSQFRAFSGVNTNNPINRLKKLAAASWWKGELVYSRFMPFTPALTIGALTNSMYLTLQLLGMYSVAYYVSVWLYLCYKMARYHYTQNDIRTL